MLLRAGGIADAMRVLDLGTGLGHVAFAVREIVGPAGSVVGIDAAEALLAVAESRRTAAGLDNVEFVQADARSFRAGKPFDAVVARLLLFHLPDAVDVMRHHRAALRPGGIGLVLDFDIGSARSQPEVPLVTTALRWVEDSFRSAGANPRIGARLALILGEAGFAGVESFGVQGYLPPGDPRAPLLLGGVVRALAPQILAAGIATKDELGLDTIEQRLARELDAADAVLLPPAVSGAWGRAG